MENSEEIWKPVVGHEGSYEVSNLGRVRSLDRDITIQTRWGMSATRSLKGRVLRHTDNGTGYLQVQLCDSAGRHPMLVHRLVAAAFVGRADGREFVNHIDGNKTNNTAANLEWCTRTENMLHAHANYLIASYRVAVIGTCLITGRETYYEQQIDAEIALSGTGKPSSAINHCLAGRKKTAYGHAWRAA